MRKKKVKVLFIQYVQLFCDLMNYSLPGSSVHGILQARFLEWVVFSSPGDLPYRGIQPRSPEWQADSLPSKPPGKPNLEMYCIKIYE